MAWYEAHQTMAKHPKTLKLARLLKVDRRYAVGLLHDLFCWALDVAGKYGELPDMTADDVAAALDMPGKKGVTVVAYLVDVGYLELSEAGNYCIHDWYDYAGKLMDKREADKERKAEIRADRRRKSGGNPPDVQRKSGGNPPDVQRKSGGNPLVTVPNQTIPDLSNQSSLKTTTTGKGEEDIKRARAREVVGVVDGGEEKLGRVVAYYQRHILGRAAPTMVVQDLRHFCGVMDEDVITDAFDVALTENNRQWSYIRGVLESRERGGVTDMAGVLRDRERHRRTRGKASGKAARPYGAESTPKADASSIDRLDRLLAKYEDDSS